MFTIKWILVERYDWVKLYKRIAPKVLVLPFESVKADKLEDVVIVGINTQHNAIWKQPLPVGTIYLIGGKIRGGQPGWSKWRMSLKRIHHFEVGGTSIATGYITIASSVEHAPSFKPKALTFLPYPAAGVNTILDCTISEGYHVRTALKLAEVAPTQAWRTHRKYYNPQGLFPWDVKDPVFLCKCVFAPHKLTARRLSLEEKLLITDIPVSIQKILSTGDANNIVTHCATPLKCFSAVISVLFLHASIEIGGGFSSFFPFSYSV